MITIIISGKSGSGKDTLANAFQTQLEKNGNKTLVIHFADLVKFYALIYYKWNGEKNEAGRALLQNIGTEMMRKYDEDYWAEIVAKFIDAAYCDFDVALIPDWRFINEYECICDYNKDVYSVRVERYNEDGTSYINPNMTPAQRSHVSETELDKFVFDYIVENRGGLEDLEDSADLIIEDIMKDLMKE